MALLVSPKVTTMTTASESHSSSHHVNLEMKVSHGVHLGDNLFCSCVNHVNARIIAYSPQNVNHVKMHLEYPHCVGIRITTDDGSHKYYRKISTTSTDATWPAVFVDLLKESPTQGHRSCLVLSFTDDPDALTLSLCISKKIGNAYAEPISLQIQAHAI
jgi:hypothetical protein